MSHRTSNILRSKQAPLSVVHLSKWCITTAIQNNFCRYLYRCLFVWIIAATFFDMHVRGVYHERSTGKALARNHNSHTKSTIWFVSFNACFSWCWHFHIAYKRDEYYIGPISKCTQYTSYIHDSDCVYGTYLGICAVISTRNTSIICSIHSHSYSIYLCQLRMIWMNKNVWTWLPAAIFQKWNHPSAYIT